MTGRIFAAFWPTNILNTFYTKWENENRKCWKVGKNSGKIWQEKGNLELSLHLLKRLTSNGIAVYIDKFSFEISFICSCWFWLISIRISSLTLLLQVSSLLKLSWNRDNLNKKHQSTTYCITKAIYNLEFDGQLVLSPLVPFIRDYLHMRFLLVGSWKQYFHLYYKTRSYNSAALLPLIHTLCSLL